MPFEISFEVYDGYEEWVDSMCVRNPSHEAGIDNLSDEFEEPDLSQLDEVFLFHQSFTPEDIEEDIDRGIKIETPEIPQSEEESDSSAAPAHFNIPPGQNIMVNASYVPLRLDGKADGITLVNSNYQEDVKIGDESDPVDVEGKLVARANLGNDLEVHLGEVRNSDVYLFSDAAVDGRVECLNNSDLYIESRFQDTLSVGERLGDSEVNEVDFQY